ncbi:MAG: hypothetical protein QW478_01890 [Candidatus Micrarchaeaceae archaeon]
MHTTYKYNKMYLYVYPDLYKILSNYLNYNDKLSLAKTCKTFWLEFKKEFTLNVGKYKFKPVQVMLYKFFIQNEKVTIVTSYKFNNVSVGLAIIFKDYETNKKRKNKLWVVILPPSNIKTWLIESEKMFYKFNDDFNSPIVIVNSKFNNNISPYTWCLLLPLYMYNNINIDILNNSNIMIFNYKNSYDWNKMVLFLKSNVKNINKFVVFKNGGS